MPDWFSVAGALAARNGAPIVVVDPGGGIVFASARLESLLGVLPGSLGGRKWSDVASAADGGISRPEDLVPGTAAFDAVVAAADGARYALTFDVSQVGEGEARGVLLVASASTRIDDEEARDFDYDVSLDDRYALLRADRAPRATLTDTARPSRCYEALYGRTTPCELCPLPADPKLSSPAGGELKPWQRSTATMRSDGRFVVLSATSAEGHAKILVRHLPSSTLGALHEAKLRALSVRAGLSPREVSVLEHLARGETLDDIATTLEIRPRTVKFHQRNALEKLGVDSRHDLLRLLF